MRRDGQASLEMTLAMIGALLLLFGALKVFIWINRRIVLRQQRYEATRVVAGSSNSVTSWNEPTEKLTILGP